MEVALRNWLLVQQLRSALQIIQLDVLLPPVLWLPTFVLRSTVPGGCHAQAVVVQAPTVNVQPVLPVLQDIPDVLKVRVGKVAWASFETKLLSVNFL